MVLCVLFPPIAKVGRREGKRFATNIPKQVGSVGLFSPIAAKATARVGWVVVGSWIKNWPGSDPIWDFEASIPEFQINPFSGSQS